MIAKRKSAALRLTAALCAAALSAAGLAACSSVKEDVPAETSYHIIYADTGESVKRTEKPVETRFVDPPAEMTSRYGYDRLSDDEKEIYDRINEAVRNCEKKVEIPNIDESGTLYSRIFELIRIENSAYFHLADRRVGDTSIGAQSFTVELTYKYTPEELNTMLHSVEAAAAGIMSRVTGDMSDYEKLKLFHDSLITGCASDTSGEYADTIYGALVDGKALCEGFAKAFSYLCNLAGIENVIVTGNTSSAHMWNMVRLDGNWYHVDVTWDHPERMIAEKYPDMVLYRYFLVGDADIAMTRTIDSSLYDPPRSMSSAMNYYYQSGMYADSYESALSAVEKGCRSAYEDGRHSFTVMVSTDKLFGSIIKKLTVRSGDGSTDIAAVMERAGYKGKISYTDLYSSDRILVFLMDY